jgi:hypothetical protein
VKLTAVGRFFRVLKEVNYGLIFANDTHSIKAKTISIDLQMLKRRNR